jgi:hypothetical protein
MSKKITSLSSDFLIDTGKKKSSVNHKNENRLFVHTIFKPKLSIFYLYSNAVHTCSSQPYNISGSSYTTSRLGAWIIFPVYLSHFLNKNVIFFIIIKIIYTIDT